MPEILTNTAQLARLPKVVLFGLPGSGKTTLGRDLEERYGYTFYDTDDDLTPECLVACEKNLPFTDKMRRDWHDAINARTLSLTANRVKIAIASPFSRESFREEFLNRFPDFSFVYVDVSERVRLNRVATRQAANPSHPLTLDYAAECVKTFEPIRIPFTYFYN